MKKVKNTSEVYLASFSKNNNESTQRAYLHIKICSIANDDWGAVDGWDFKQYILGILFIDLLLKIWQNSLIQLINKQVI